MKNIKKILAGIGVISIAILAGCGYQYLDSKQIFTQHKNGLLQNEEYMKDNNVSVSMSILRIKGFNENINKINYVSYDDKKVKDIVSNFKKNNKGEIISSKSNIGYFSYFNKDGNNNSFNGTATLDNNNINYRIESHYENNHFSTRIYLMRNVLDEKDSNILNNSLVFVTSIPYNDKSTIVKLPWNIDTNSYDFIIFKIIKK